MHPRQPFLDKIQSGSGVADTPLKFRQWLEYGFESSTRCQLRSMPRTIELSRKEPKGLQKNSKGQESLEKQEPTRGHTHSDASASS
jgi:hypothetical protein